MGWSHIVGQQRAISMLQQALIQQRTPQALLLIGDDGAGALAVALEFARTILCEAPHVTQRTYDRCEECRSCRQSSDLRHPNLHLVLPLPTGKSGTEAELSSVQVEEWKQLITDVVADPYQPARMSNAAAIRIGQIRELKRQLAMSSASSGRRIVLIHHAEDMNTEASNAFLKTLEEPHSDTTILLTCQQPEGLLSTIRSRCQELVIPPIDDVSIAEYLVQQEKVSEAESLIVVAFAQGSLHQARTIVSENVRDDRVVAIELLRTALRGRNYRVELLQQIEAIGADRNRDRVLSILSLLTLWLRDARMITVYGADAAVTNVDQKEALVRFADGFKGADYDQALAVLEEAAKDVHKNMSLPLLLLSCMLFLRRVFAVARAGTPHTRE